MTVGFIGHAKINAKQNITFMDYKKDLADKLPALKKIEGFPIGKDEDILALSHPPYFTACPNPYIEDFIKENGKTYDEKTDQYNKEPFVGDISEGKNHAIYNAHSYHTKVPHKAIMQFINHYTEEGDIVLDAFAGTGMTGVAAQLLNRKAILSDLSPIASFIAYNYNVTVDIDEFEKEAKRIVNELTEEYGWMYETCHANEAEQDNQYTTSGEKQAKKGVVNFILYSDVIICAYCNHEFTFYDVAVDSVNHKILSKFNCPHCKAMQSKNDCKPSIVEVYDDIVGQKIKRIKQIPVRINYTVRIQEKGKWKSKRFEKAPDNEDISLISKIEKLNIPHWLPLDRMMLKNSTSWGDTWRAGVHFGISNVHHFYTKVNLFLMAAYWEKASKIKNRTGHALLLAHSAANLTLSKMRRFRPDKKGGGPLSGTMYLSSLFTPPNVILSIGRNIEFVKAAFKEIAVLKNDIRIQVCSATVLNIPSSSIDYIFTDPPFGDNLLYSELNFIWEAWIRVFTNQNSEAVISTAQRKQLQEYNTLMLASFKEYYRVLKPNRWITVEFHNSSSKVWNGIQEAMIKAGFIIAQVAVLDKKQGSFKQVMAPGSVSNDLVISAYKPNRQFEEKFLSSSGLNLEVEFIEQFLGKLPKEPTIERTEKMLYSKMLAYYIQRGYEISHDAKSFYSLLNKHFIQEDGFWFTSSQINSYIEYKKQMKLEGISEIKAGNAFLFVTDEKSAVVWLYSFLSSPKTYSDISVAFNQLANIQGDAVPELRVLLEQNFISEDGKFRRPKTEPEHNMIAEKRERVLMKEFESLLVFAQTEKKKIKDVRKEALMLGFENCYKNKRFQDILTIAKKLDKSILENSGELTDFVEAADIVLHGVS